MNRSALFRFVFLSPMIYDILTISLLFKPHAQVFFYSTYTAKCVCVCVCDGFYSSIGAEDNSCRKNDCGLHLTISCILFDCTVMFGC